MSNLAYDYNVIFAPPPQYTCKVGKGAANMTKKQKNEIDYDNIKIIHTVPKMTDTEREKSKKMIGNDLYEVFLRIQSRLNLDNENK